MKLIKSRVWRVCLTVTLALYPLYVWWAVQNLAPLAALLPLAVIAFLRSISTSKKHSATKLFYLSTVVLLVIAFSWRESERALLFYPVWVNLGMLMLFGWSLMRPPSMVTQLANFAEGPLDAKGIVYTTKVTKIWCVFFIFNGSIALGTALHGNWDIWVLYNGMLSYMLMGLLVLVEWRVRNIVKARN